MRVPQDRSGGHVRICAFGSVLLVVCLAVGLFARGASADQNAAPPSPVAGMLDAGWYHTCAVLTAGTVRCWGYGRDGQLGYGNAENVGDDETPGSAGPVDLGGRTATAVAAGDFHTCALLDDASVRCWGFGGEGRLGYANTDAIRDPGAAGPVDLGGPAKAISADAAHTCALLQDGSVLCWGYGGQGFPRDGRLGYGNTANVGDDETPASVGPVKLGAGRTAVAISAGREHTCALLDDRTVKCWGRNFSGQLGYGSTTSQGDAPATTPDKLDPVNLGPGRTATAISAGGSHTCALLDDRSLRCWGAGAAGQLGYANTDTIGDNELPGSVGPVDVGAGRVATAITTGDLHTCARLDDGSVRCWGLGRTGRLGSPARGDGDVGDDEAPGSVAPVDLGAGRTAVAISAGRNHTCARLDDGSVRCWGQGTYGRLGYCSQQVVGDDETPGAAGPVDLGEPGARGTGCPVPPGGAPGSGGGPSGAPAPPGPPATASDRAAPARPDGPRALRLRRCLAQVADREKRAGRRAAPGLRAPPAGGRSGPAARGRRECLRRYGRIPGRVTGLRARPVARTRVTLAFDAPGTDASRPPPARSYLVKQSLRPMRGARDFARAQTLCRGRCRLTAPRIGDRVSLTVTGLRPHTTYYYAVAAQDNVSGRSGPRAQVVVRTR